MNNCFYHYQPYAPQNERNHQDHQDKHSLEASTGPGAPMFRFQPIPVPNQLYFGTLPYPPQAHGPGLLRAQNPEAQPDQLQQLQAKIQKLGQEAIVHYQSLNEAKAEITKLQHKNQELEDEAKKTNDEKDETISRLAHLLKIAEIDVSCHKLSALWFQLYYSHKAERTAERTEPQQTENLGFSIKKEILDHDELSPPSSCSTNSVVYSDPTGLEFDDITPFDPDASDVVEVPASPPVFIEKLSFADGVRLYRAWGPEEKLAGINGVDFTKFMFNVNTPTKLPQFVRKASNGVTLFREQFYENNGAKAGGFILLH
ncbi:DUF1421 domain-containing protein [Caenorhabditis elegans]|uniref:DUF1421 domain-containing protein n=1 Tax=Caenorhabditis elegans TaxID=6239 RepID=O02067_CAEEL|nr:DUF1421 domain-containing protein [Caenorhabditis elegans]CCD69695.1 DUF1421 domain-containing protein [Caenorhabditis elegans]|eukprot:NP_494605.1 Uncharacterized protein CELE_F19B10.5 [Caenorhabditis elegans]